jgi:hypothetical protein
MTYGVIMLTTKMAATTGKQTHDPVRTHRTATKKTIDNAQPKIRKPEAVAIKPRIAANSSSLT